MIELFEIIMQQWSLMCREDILVELVILADGHWGLSSARRLTHSETDVSIKGILSKNDNNDQDSNYFG